MILFSIRFLKLLLIKANQLTENGREKIKINRTLIQFIIGISIIVFIFNKLNIYEVLSVLKNVDVLYFILGCIFYLFLNLVLASRLKYLLIKLGYKINYSGVFASHMGGMLVGDITPGRSGYFLTPSILKKKANISVTDGMVCIFAPQGIEFILKVAGAIAAIFYISTFEKNIGIDIVLSAAIGITLLLLVGIIMLKFSWQNEKISSRFLSKIPFLNKFTENILDFKEKSLLLKGSINVILILYFIGWIFAALQWLYLGKALGIDLSFFDFFLLHPLLTILMFVPISPAGLGLLEGGIVVVFLMLGIPPTQSLAFSVLVRVSILSVDMAGLKTLLSSIWNFRFNF